METNPVNRTRKSLLLLLAVLLALAAFPIVRALFTAPLLRSLVSFWNYIISIPQIYLWVVGLFFFTWVTIRSIGRLVSRDTRILDFRRLYRNRIELWSHWLAMRNRGRYSRWLLMNRVSKLAIKVIAQRRRQTPNTLRDEILSRTSDLPQPIQAYLRTGTTPLGMIPSSPWFMRWFKRNSVTWQMNPEVVIEYLENLMEVKHES